MMSLTKAFEKATCNLHKLGKETIEKISRQNDARNTVLLLDALDEDTEVGDDLAARLEKVLQQCVHFRFAIITCRTQFFPQRDRDSFERDGVFRFHGFKCRLKYLSYFTEGQVDEYVKKWAELQGRSSADTDAARLCALMGPLALRPMLLAHIDSLLESRKVREALELERDKHAEKSGHPEQLTTYWLYGALIDAWLSREETKLREQKKDITIDDLLYCCENLTGSTRHSAIC